MNAQYVQKNSGQRIDELQRLIQLHCSLPKRIVGEDITITAAGKTYSLKLKKITS